MHVSHKLNHTKTPNKNKYKIVQDTIKSSYNIYIDKNVVAKWSINKMVMTKCTGDEGKS